MPVTCPNGHTSADPEWCDTCGARLTGPPASTPSSLAAPPAQGTAAARPAGATSAPGEPCPHCSTPNEAGALFCEACGYDFTTGQAPPEATPPPAAPAALAPAEAAGWVVVAEVDAHWYELKGQLSERPCPPATSSTVSLGGATALIGRTSQSRQLFPDVALDGDTGVSRRHAQLARTVDGGWTVVDLESANGTYVVAAGAEPDADLEPIEVGVPTAVHDRDAIYLGAWTKLTLRDAGAEGRAAHDEPAITRG